MPTFDASQATYNEPVQNRLGDFGVSFPVGNCVFITSSDTVVESTTITEDQIAGTAGANNIKAGSGDLGLALFRRGLTYTITSGEQTLLDAAGYTTS